MPPIQEQKVSRCTVCATPLDNVGKCQSCQRHSLRAMSQAVALIFTIPCFFWILGNGKVDRENHSFFQPSVIEPILTILLLAGVLLLLQRWIAISSHSTPSLICPACGCPSPEASWCPRCLRLRHTTTMLLLCAVLPAIGFMSCLLTIAVDANQIWLTGMTLVVAPIVGIVLWQRWRGT